jgi:hypothetical protein
MRDQLALSDSASTDKRVATFAAELTKLSTESGIGLAQPVTLFLMDSDDYDRKYVVKDDQLEFV